MSNIELRYDCPNCGAIEFIPAEKTCFACRKYAPLNSVVRNRQIIVLIKDGKIMVKSE